MGRDIDFSINMHYVAIFDKKKNTVEGYLKAITELDITGKQ